MDLDMIVFGSFTVKDLLVYGGVAVGLIMAFSAVRKLFSSDPADRHSQPVQCMSCGWRGRVSRYAGRCPQCNEPIGAQKAARS